ncbi:hypothetical protein M9H77_17291 [Catharanthus roseus]|uniref:Uncharacterized protein n=1 Tax=Catharanthus roseus TaxID=4058 RepID=A0ACC0B484_CATRO|nr:hypothetical protein M9H77_17291 [Catharanthus roseus]
MDIDGTHFVKVVYFETRSMLEIRLVLFHRSGKENMGVYPDEYHMFNYTLYSMNNDDEMHYLWTIRPDIPKEGIHVLVEFEPVQTQAFTDAQHSHVSACEDHSNVHQHVTEIMQIVSDEPSMLYPNLQEDDEDSDDNDTDYKVSSASDDNNSDNDKEDDISTPLDTLSSTAVNQWQSSQLFSNKSDFEDDEEDTDSNETVTFNMIIDLKDTSMHNDHKDDNDDDSIYTDEPKKIQEQKDALEKRNYKLMTHVKDATERVNMAKEKNSNIEHWKD